MESWLNFSEVLTKVENSYLTLWYLDKNKGTKRSMISTFTRSNKHKHITLIDMIEKSKVLECCKASTKQLWYLDKNSTYICPVQFHAKAINVEAVIGANLLLYKIIYK